MEQYESNNFPEFEHETPEQRWMYKEAQKEYLPFCAGYVRYSEGKDPEPYVDLYIYTKPWEKERLILKKGAFCPGELTMLKNINTCRYDRENMETLMKAFHDTFPDCHMIYYLDDYPQALLHILYTLCSNNRIKKLAFKSGLGHLASYEFMEDINKNGSNLEAIFEIPLHMLRSLQNITWENMKTKEKRLEAACIYKAYPNLIRGVTLNEAQYDYLQDCYTRKQNPNSKLFHFLKNLQDEDDFEMFFDYLEARKKLDNEIPLIPSNNEETGLSWRDSEAINNIICDETRAEMDARFSKLYHLNQNLHYESSKYIIRSPLNVKEFYLEAIHMHNCLINSYIYDVLRNDEKRRIILFMRDTNEPNKPFIDIEIVYDKVISQARGVCNRKLSEEEYQFVIRYAKQKNLTVAINQ